MSKESRVYDIFQSISEDYDSANMRISMGQHLRWKRAAVKLLSHMTRAGGKILDLCCGTGDIACLLLEESKCFEVTGVDFSSNMLAVAKRRAGENNRLQLAEGDAMKLSFADDSFDCAIISFALRNTADYQQVLREMTRVVRPGGAVCCMDSFYPRLPLVKPFYSLYFRYLMPLLGGGLRRRENYFWLYQTTKEFITAQRLRILMQKAGLSKLQGRSYLFGSCVCLYGYKIG